MSTRIRAGLLAVAAVVLALAALSIVPLSAQASPARSLAVASDEPSDTTSAAGDPTATDSSSASPTDGASTTSPPAPVTVPGCSAGYRAGSGDTFTATEPLVRTFGNGSAPDTRCFRLNVDKHTQLQDHERITVKWSGAHVTGGRSLNPYGESGLPQEYPVLLMECRGVDPKDGTVASGAEQVSPQTCWTNTYFQRTSSADPGKGIWQQDADASAADIGHISGIDQADIPTDCGVSDVFDYHITPFLAADKKLYAGCSSQSMPPEATVNSVSIPNEAAAFTNTNGDGSFQFEVRTDVENQSLGCSSTVPCTLEVIPIDGIDCAPTNDSPECNSTGNLPPGQVNPGSAPADAVAPAYWWSASNWDRRVPVPLNFAPPASVCQIADAGSPVPFYGSELLSQAALQWTPAYCLNKNRFNWQDNVMPDTAAFSLMTGGQAAAAEVSARRPDDDGIAYAPTAVSGWGIAFDIDKPGNAGEQTTLNLNARLLAKLLTESYPGAIPTLQTHPGFSHNPVSLNLDPEFQKLNPGLDTTHWSEAASVLMSLNTSSDVMEQLTSYIAADPQAMAFIHGKPDPWGMRVNPFYKNMTLPVSSWPLLDTWINKTTNNPCLSAAQTAYMPLMASPVSSLRLISTAMLYNWPYVGTGCTGTGTQDSPFQLGRVATEGLGNRFILGLVTLGDAARYGLTVAHLQAAPGHYVAPNNAGMAAAVRIAKPAKGLKPFDISQADIRKSKTAYPGTMVVYSAAKTHGLAQDTATDVSQFVRVSTTEGQKPGRGNGQLPAGYLPITNAGVTKPLYAAARKAAAAIAAQKAPANQGTPTGPSSSPTSPAGGTDGTTPDGTTPGGATPVGQVPGGATPSGGASPTAAPSDGTAVTSEQTVATAAVTSSLGGSLMPILLVLGIAAGLVTVGGRIWLRVKGLK